METSVDQPRIFSSPAAVEYFDFGRLFLANFFQNMLMLPNAYQAHDLYGKFKGVPAVICGAGPSLAKNIGVLKNLRGNALIFAGGTAMNALNTFNLLPHFGVGVDPNAAQLSRIIMNHAYETPFLYRNRLCHEALKIIHGDHLYVPGSGGYEITRWFEENLSLSGTDIEEGYSIISFSLAIAQAMGCNPLVLVGADLAYTDMESYAPNIIHHPLHERSVYFRTKSIDEELVSRTDIYGKPVYTLEKWINESRWISEFAQKHPETVLLNCTEGGIGFQSIPAMPLKSAADHWLDKQYDLEGMRTAAIQQAQIPAAVTIEKVRDLMGGLLVSLEKCREYCSIIRHDFEVLERHLLKGGEYPDNMLSAPAIQALSDMEEESAYRCLLKAFSDKYIEMHTREVEEEACDEDLLTEQERMLKRVMLNTARYKFLVNGTGEIEKIIENVLREHSLADAQTTVHAIQEVRYSSQDTAKSVNLSHTAISGESVAKIVCHYSGGSLLSEQGYMGNFLHGQSVYYALTGQILSSCCFEKGLKEGVAQTYYLSGALQSVQRFRGGRPDGQQEYYYQNGTLKSLITYSQGVLEGVVQLYYPNGRRRREVNFLKGKRHGLELFWNEAGGLYIQAEYEMDKPVGTARQWHKNGTMQREVQYHVDKHGCVIREWDINGVSIIHDKVLEGDYFDRLVAHTENLTEGLKTVIEQVASAMPKIGAALDPDRKQNFDTAFHDQLNSIKKEFASLDEITHQLISAAGLEPGNISEAIWKTPSSRREVECKVSFLADTMAKEMQGVHDSLKNALEVLLKSLSHTTK